MPQTCAICTRPVKDDEIRETGMSPGSGRYCSYHEQALRTLKEHYNQWVRAYGEMPWKEYLRKLEKMKETGDWIKQVAVAELDKSPA